MIQRPGRPGKQAAAPFSRGSAGAVRAMLDSRPAPLPGTDMSFPIEHDANASRLTARIDGHLSQLQYRLRDGVLTIVHTEVPPELEGHGIGADLVRSAFEMARANGWRVRPACSFARAFVERHAEYRDLVD
jgi:predicted GNAT family acetyltransferase